MSLRIADPDQEKCKATMKSTCSPDIAEGCTHPNSNCKHEPKPNSAVTQNVGMRKPSKQAKSAHDAIQSTPAHGAAGSDDLREKAMDMGGRLSMSKAVQYQASTELRHRRALKTDGRRREANRAMNGPTDRANRQWAGH